MCVQWTSSNDHLFNPLAVDDEISVTVSKKNPPANGLKRGQKEKNNLDQYYIQPF
jgi:hypothetical protein